MAITIGGGGGLQSGATNLSGGLPIAQGSPGVAGSARIQPASPSPRVAGSSVLNPTAASVARSGAAVNQLQSQGDALLARTKALLAEFNSRPAPVYGQVLNTDAYYNRATADATKASNPYYHKLLNEFIGQQATTKQQQQQQTDVNIQNLQDQLAQLEKANTVSGERATQDTATSEANAALATDNRQLDQGTQFNTDRNALAIKQAESGLTGSGLAAGQTGTAQQTQDTTESRQAAADQEAKNAAELSKARTFEDLATSNTNAASSTTKGVTQAKFDLNKFIQGQTMDLTNKRGDLQLQQKSQVLQDATRRTRVMVQNAINAIANPAVRSATQNVYGSYL